MNFKEYSDIKNMTEREYGKFKDFSTANGLDRYLWYVLEKIDGANFALYKTKDGPIIPARRKGFLSMDSNFFSFQRIFDKYDFEKVFEVLFRQQERVRHEIKDFVGISIHGELFGGGYKGMDKATPFLSRIQKKANYSNDIEFMVFDIKVYDSDGNGYYTNFDYVIDMCEMTGLKVAPIMFAGSFDMCYKWSKIHKHNNSAVPGILNMPELESNLREGHVLRPKINLNYPNGSRIIFKDKNPDFDDNKSGEKKPKEKFNYSMEGQIMSDTIDGMINKNRWHSMISKHGDNYSIKDFRMFIDEIANDIWDEFDKYDELKEMKSMIGSEELAIIKKNMKTKIGKWMNTHKNEIF